MVSRAYAIALPAIVALALGCGPKAPPAPPPGPPIAADPPVTLRDMPLECDALIGALTAFRACPHLDAEDREDLTDWIERAQKDMAAGRKASPEPGAARAIALACYRATRSVEAATTRCNAGPRPKDAWYLRRRR